MCWFLVGFLVGLDYWSSGLAVEKSWLWPGGSSKPASPAVAALITLGPSVLRAQLLLLSSRFLNVAHFFCAQV